MSTVSLVYIFYELWTSLMWIVEGMRMILRRGWPPSSNPQLCLDIWLLPLFIFAMLAGMVSTLATCPDQIRICWTGGVCYISPGPADNFASLPPPKYVCSVKTNVKSKFASGWVQCVCLWPSPSLTWDAGIGQVDHWYVIAITLRQSHNWLWPGTTSVSWMSYSCLCVLWDRCDMK